jgi:hypothetical protein
MQKHIEQLKALQKEVNKELQKALKKPDQEALRMFKLLKGEKKLAEAVEDLEVSILYVDYLQNGFPKPKQEPLPEPYKPPILPTDENGFSECEVID